MVDFPLTIAVTGAPDGKPMTVECNFMMTTKEHADKAIKALHIVRDLLADPEVPTPNQEGGDHGSQGDST